MLAAPILNNGNASAVTTPDSCFAFDSTTGTITDYYANQGNNSANPACPKDVDIPAVIGGTAVKVIGDSAFASKSLALVTIPNSVTSIGTAAFYGNNLTSVAIPSSVTSIAGSAFAMNQLTSVAIPSSVTSIGVGAFTMNQLTSVTIPSSVTSIDAAAFAMNQLTSVTIPSSVTSIGVQAFISNKLNSVTIPSSVTSIGLMAFALQSSYGASAYSTMVGSDAQAKQEVLSSIWCAQLYTENPSNPNGLKDEALYADIDGDGKSENIGGHLINPAPVTETYKNNSGVEVAASQTVTGVKTDGTIMHDYLAVNGPVIPTAVDAFNPTAAELAAMAAALSVYQRGGQSFTATAPTVSGYSIITPATPHALILKFGTNNVDFVYSDTGDEPTSLIVVAPNTGVKI